MNWRCCRRHNECDAWKDLTVKQRSTGIAYPSLTVPACNEVEEELVIKLTASLITMVMVRTSRDLNRAARHYIQRGPLRSCYEHI